MIICVCQWRRGKDDKLIHVDNQISCVRVCDVRCPEGTYLTTNRGKFFRSAAHLEISLHGWEHLEDG